MKLSTTSDIFELMESYISSAAVCAAMEVGLFWLLDEKPLDTTTISQALDIPEGRCRHWLELLRGIGLLERTAADYAPSNTARTAIIDAYSQDVWSYLGKSEQTFFPTIVEVVGQLQDPESTWEARGLKQPNYVEQMTKSPEKATQFTRMLYELHLEMADELANMLDLSDACRLMDLGGGSGVMSFALLRKNPQLSAVVVDMKNVCAAGSVIAVENNLSDRITYHAADFLNEPLPSGVDVVLESDLSIHNEALFRKIFASLNTGDRFVIVDLFAPAAGFAHPTRLHWAFRGSLNNPDYAVKTVDDIQAMLTTVGFDVADVGELTEGWSVIVARK